MVEQPDIEKTFILPDPDQALNLLGINDEYLHLLEEGLNVSIHAFGEKIVVTGSAVAVDRVVSIFEQLARLLRQGVMINNSDIISAMKMADRGTLAYFSDLYTEEIVRDAKGRSIRVKNLGQRQYVQSVKHNEITFGIGPAGTGKTYLAVALAVAALKANEVQRIILTRPAVEAGENLGFLPGDLKDKIDPYLRPIYDALYNIMGTEHANRLMERGIIEIAPLAYMRGRTLEEALVILDEAQNTTPAQMKMFLTRLGMNSKMIVNGDVTQIDLPHNQRSGLIEAAHVLKNVKHIGFVELSSSDVVRHPVVASIIDAYEKYDQEQVKKDESGNN
ncbi:PhoH family protein [Lapidilactobacillus bayanensis]|uniref:PhoH family protein n=1 Tax=Lapidilactobacillus bayanensis TaxID=2485998 RepID=UPI000F79B54F|nr:PhoH family protein [Lapidilactobacillus bayanensis]